MTYFNGSPGTTPSFDPFAPPPVGPVAPSAWPLIADAAPTPWPTAPPPQPAPPSGHLPEEHPASDDPASGGAGAAWVVGLGAALLCASATVFVALRWEQIPLWTKLAGLVAATQGLLIAGRVLRERLPITASALFHTGSLFIPLDVCALAGVAGWGWARAILAGGTAGAVWFTATAVVTPSPILRRAAMVSTVVALAGLAATTGASVGILVAVAAVLAASTPAVRGYRPDEADRAALLWGSVAGIAPVAAVLRQTMVVGDGVLEQLGLTTASLGWSTMAAGALVTIAFAIVARRRGHTNLFFAGAGLGTLNVAAGLMALGDLRPDVLLTAVAGTVTMSVVSLIVVRDRFWGPAMTVVARASEIVAATISVAILFTAAASSLWGAVQPTWAWAAGLALVGWFAGDTREHLLSGGRPTEFGFGRPARSWDTPAAIGSEPFTVAAAVSITACALAAGVEGTSLALLTAGMAVAMILTERAAGRSTGAVLIAFASTLLVTSDHLGVAVLVALTTVAALALAARRAEGAASPAVAATAAAPLAMLGSVMSDGLGTSQAVLCVTLLSVCAAHLADAPRRPNCLGHVPFHAFGAATAASMLWSDQLGSPAALASAAIVVASLLVANAVCRRQHIVIAAAAATPLLTVNAAVIAGIDHPHLGLVAAVSAAFFGAVTLVSDRWSAGTLRTVGLAHGAFALLFATRFADTETVTSAWTFLIVGVAGMALSFASRFEPGFWMSVLLAFSGTYMVLLDSQIDSIDLWIAPIGVGLLLAGARVRMSERVSTWIAYGPSLAVVGAAGLVERMGGAPSWHTAAVGAVGIIAVAVGGARKLAAPLVVGSALIAGTALVEFMALSVDVPLWVWLGIGGTALVTSGAFMERRNLGPVRTFRHVAALVAERFE